MSVKLGAGNWGSATSHAGMFKVAAVVNVGLAASSVTQTSATLTLTGHSGKWWYQGSESGAACMEVASGASSFDLANLTPSTSYTYLAYRSADCASGNEMASETFKTLAQQVSVSNLDETLESYWLGVGNPGTVDTRRAGGFTTGDHSGGYTLESVTAKFAAKSGTPAALTASIYSQSGSGPGSSLVTLTGSDPDTAGDHTYTCSGNGCDLSANTTYYVVFASPGTQGASYYNWRATASGNQTNTPSGAGWSIDDKVQTKTGAGQWTTVQGSQYNGVFKVTATTR